MTKGSVQFRNVVCCEKRGSSNQKVAKVDVVFGLMAWRGIGKARTWSTCQLWPDHSKLPCRWNRTHRRLPNPCPADTKSGPHLILSNLEDLIVPPRHNFLRGTGPGLKVGGVDESCSRVNSSLIHNLTRLLECVLSSSNCQHVFRHQGHAPSHRRGLESPRSG